MRNGLKSGRLRSNYVSRITVLFPMHKEAGNMEDSKITEWVGKLVTACSDSGDADGVVDELTSGPVIFTEQDFADHLRIHHPGVPARVEMVDGFLNIHAGFSIFSLTFVCTADVDPSGKIAYMRQEKGPALKNFLDIEGMCYYFLF